MVMAEWLQQLGLYQLLNQYEWKYDIVWAIFGCIVIEIGISAFFQRKQLAFGRILSLFQ